MSDVSRPRSIPLVRLFSHIDSGIWGMEPDDPGAEVVLRCIRAADISTDALVVHSQNETYRGYLRREVLTRTVVDGDLVIEKSGGGETQPVGRVALFRDPVPAITSNFMARLRPDAQTVLPTFAARLLQSLWRSRCTVDHTSQTTGIQNLDLHQFLRRRVAIPTLDHQRSTVRFLEERERDIEHYLATKRRMIDVLERYRDAVISTSMNLSSAPGDPSCPMVALRRVSEVVDCKHVTAEFTDSGYPLASVREVQSITVDLSTSNKTTAKYYESLIEGGRRPRRGDLIFCRNTSINVSLVETDQEFAMGQDVCLIKGDRVHGRFLVHALRSAVVREQLDRLLVGATIKRVNVADVRNLSVPAYTLDEQRRIAQRIDASITPIEQAENVIQREIAVMEEYRTRLIADAVTGQIDVRRVA